MRVVVASSRFPWPPYTGDRLRTTVWLEALSRDHEVTLVTTDIGPQYFKDVGAVVNAGGPPDKAALLAVMSRYGLVPAAQGGA